MNSSPTIVRFSSGSVTPASRVRKRSCAAHVHERHVEVAAERLDHLLGLVRAQQAVVDEDAGELVADRLVHEQRRDRRVDAAGEPADHALRADLRPDPLDLLLDHRRRGPRGRRAGDVVEEVLQHRPGRAACARPRGGTGRRRGRASGSSKAAIGVDGDEAVTRAPAGGAVTESRWLIQTVCSLGQVAEERRLARSAASALPYSDDVVRLDRAAEVAAPSAASRSRCRASASPSSKIRGVHLRRALRVHRGRPAGEDQRERVPRPHLLGA